jgi:hypothetical protein
MFDKIFKILIVIIALGFLAVYFMSLDDHRYSLQLEKDVPLVTVFDSKMGKLYIARGKEGWLVHDPVKKAFPLTTNYVFPKNK